MNSLDTNILFYAANEDCKEHDKARALVQQALDHSVEWIISDQVYFELYRLLRNPIVLEHPLSAPRAWEIIDFYRHQSGWMHCCYETSFMTEIAEFLKSNEFPPRKTFDSVLAVTLNKHGVSTFYTRNKGDFEPFHWFKLIDPLK
jgi:toxin-antitoxin system PIN domain toxin